ncbi:MAG TPA: hypothetical protein PKL48_09070, partial [Thermodesulfobacteriota bacterium]|nr:hypothetical protein [Thermodesulfobacteriota bacterium]
MESLDTVTTEAGTYSIEEYVAMEEAAEVQADLAADLHGLKRSLYTRPHLRVPAPTGNRNGPVKIYSYFGRMKLMEENRFNKMESTHHAMIAYLAEQKTLCTYAELYKGINRGTYGSLTTCASQLLRVLGNQFIDLRHIKGIAHIGLTQEAQEMGIEALWQKWEAGKGTLNEIWNRKQKRAAVRDQAGKALTASSANGGRQSVPS